MRLVKVSSLCPTKMSLFYLNLSLLQASRFWLNTSAWVKHADGGVQVKVLEPNQRESKSGTARTSGNSSERYKRCSYPVKGRGRLTLNNLNRRYNLLNTDIDTNKGEI